MIKNPRYLPDGSLVFPVGSDLPMELKGYEQDPRDFYRWVPKIPDCVHREFKEVKLKCGKLTTKMFCKELGLEVTNDTCIHCKLPKN